MTAVRNLVGTWFPVFGSIPAWAAHVVFIAGLARYTCTVPSTRWTLHAITAAGKQFLDGDVGQAPAL